MRGRNFFFFFHKLILGCCWFRFQGTPFIAKSYDATKVAVGSVSKGTVGRNVQFTVDAGEAGEGNLEITISAKGHNIPTQVHPQGNAK